jgi:hypothetical protein
MSDTADDEFRAKHLLNKSKTHSLRERMRRFVSEHGESTDFKQLREEVSGGQDLSRTVIEGREERL